MYAFLALVIRRPNRKRTVSDMSDLSIYERQGLGKPLGFGRKTALLVIDFQLGFTREDAFGGFNINDAIAALGEPSKKRAVGNTMELEWSDYQTAPYTEWVTTGSSQQVVGMIPATNTTAATPVFQTNTTGHYQNRSRVYECTVLMRMQNSIITSTSVDGNVCPEFIAALRKWAGENEANNYVVK